MIARAQFLLLLWAACACPAFALERWALVIGIAGYPAFPEGEKLKFAGRDAEDFATFIQTPQGGTFPPDHVHLLTGSAATRQQLYNEFDWLYRSAGPDDLVYVFFAGHGIEYKNNSYFLPYEASKSHPDGSGILMSEFFQKVTTTLSAKQVIVFIDACHAAAAVEGAREPLSIDVQKQWDALTQKEGQIDMGLFSSLAYQKSWEDDKLGSGHGLFTWYLLEGLKGAAPRSEAGWINADKLWHYVTNMVETYSKRHFPEVQTPFASPRFRVDFPLAYTIPVSASSPKKSPSVNTQGQDVTPTAQIKKSEILAPPARQGPVANSRYDEFETLKGEVSGVGDMEMSSDGSKIALADRNSIWVWDVDAKEPPKQIHQSLPGGIIWVGSSHLLGPKFSLIDVASGRQLSVPTAPKGRPTARDDSIATIISTSGLDAVRLNDAGEIHVFNPFSGVTRLTLHLTQPDLEPYLPKISRDRIKINPPRNVKLALSKDNRFLAVAGSYWITGTRQEENRKYTDNYPVPAFIEIFDLSSGTSISQFKLDRLDPEKITFSSDGILLAVLSYNSISVFDWHTGGAKYEIAEKLLNEKQRSWMDPRRDVDRVTFMDGDMNLGICSRGWFVVWNLESKEVISRTGQSSYSPDDSAFPRRGCAFAANATRIALSRRVFSLKK